MAQTNDYGNGGGGRSGAGLRGIGAAITGALDQNALREQLRPHQALALWPEIAGEQIAAVCSAEAVRGSVLFVRAKSSAWANELTFFKSDLIARLNSRLGGKIIHDIHFSTGRPSARSKAGSAATRETQPEAEVRDLGRIAPPIPSSAALDPQAKLDALVARTRSVLAWKRANGWVPCDRCGALFEPEPGALKTAKGSGSGAKRRKAAPAATCPVCVTLMRR